MPVLAVGDTIGGRYRLERQEAEHWIAAGEGASEEPSHERVVVVPLSAVELEVLRDAAAAHHPHLAQVLQVLPYGEGGVLVAEYVPGETLAERLAAVGRKRPVDAVRSCLRLADAAAALHRRGAVHGGIGPHSVVVDPAGKDGPLLSFQGSRGAYRAPEATAAAAAGPAEADDAWAIASLLYLMLTGEPAPAEGVGAEHAPAEVTDSRLRAVLLHGLNRDLAERASELKPIMGELARWFVDHAGDESVPSIRTTHPPPLPSSTPPPVNVNFAAPGIPEVAPPSRVGRFVVFALVATGVGVLAVWAFGALQKPAVVELPLPVAQASAAPSGVAEPGAEEIDLKEVAVMGSAAVPAADSASACAREHLPGLVFEAPQSLAWVCTERDGVEGAGKLRTAIVKGSKGTVTEAMRLVSQVGWYELGVYASVRRACCSDVTPTVLPAPTSGCADLAPLTDKLAETALSREPLKPALDAFEVAAMCAFDAGQGGAFRKTTRPDTASRAQFELFAKGLKAE